MDEIQIETTVAKQTPTDELMRQLGATGPGLSKEEARQRLERFGANEITEKTTHPIIQFLGYLWGPISCKSPPAGKEKGDVVYSGSIAKQGEMIALVVTTGAQTYFGRTARLVQGAGKASHFQKAVLQIGDTRIYLSLGLVAVLVIVQLFHGSGFTALLQFALILTAASIPVAMPAVLSVAMDVGAVVLSRMKAIVSRLESVEEMAGMDILCSDKTGTLTQNRLSLGEPQTFDGGDIDELVLTAALATKVLGTLLAAFGFGLIAPIHWREIAMIWDYSIVWASLTDWDKTMFYRHFNLRGQRHEHFLETVHHPLTPYATHGGVHP